MLDRTKTKIEINEETREIVFTRVFDAPRDLVFKVVTNPELIPQWWGPARYTTIVDKMDVRPGGKWRFLNRDDEGNEHAFNGEYLVVDPPKEYSYTFEYEGFPGHISTETATLQEVDGKTIMTARAVYPTLEDLRGTTQSGMEEGALETWDRLAKLVESM